MLYYDEVKHQYWWEENGERTDLTSVTSKIHKAKKPFDSYSIAGALSKKNGRDQKDIVAEWKLKGDLACDWGNAVHKSVELYVRYGAEPKTRYLQGVIQEYLKFGFVNPRAEVMTYDLETQIAGRMDLVDGDGLINIRDIKTSSGIEEKKNDFHGVLSAHIKSKLDEYTLQLSLYAFILKSRGHTIGELSILEWDDGFRKLDVPYREDWVRLLLENY
mgnify:FL=1